jgi:hypothetical protein
VRVWFVPSLLACFAFSWGFAFGYAFGDAPGRINLWLVLAAWPLAMVFFLASFWTLVFAKTFVEREVKRRKEPV